MLRRKPRSDDLLRVLRLLERAYGPRPWRQWGDPVSVLVETILSQNTSDGNSSAGYRQLRRRFRTWCEVAAAPVGEIERCIRVSGLSRVKAPRIQAALRRIRQDCAGMARPQSAGKMPATRTARRGSSPAAQDTRHGPRGGAPAPPRKAQDTNGTGPPNAIHRVWGPLPSPRISLDFVRPMTPRAATDYLRSLKGIGPKTVACVLLFSLRMPVFPVDTHILRVARRLGWLPPSVSAEKAQDLLTPLIPPRRRYAMHILLIEHGRKTCRARHPRCEWCSLLSVCPFGTKETGAREGTSPREGGRPPR